MLITLYCTDAPVVSISPQSPHTVKVGGDQISLLCIAHGLPDPTVRWYEGGQPAKNVLHQRLQVRTDYIHTTVYTCVGRNKIGTTSANITVIAIKGICKHVVFFLFCLCL